MRPARVVLPLLLLVPLLPAAPTLALDEGAPLAEDPSRVGRWLPPMAWPVQGEDAALLPTGKVLLFAFGSDAHLWDPRDGSLTPVPAPQGVNCAGLAFLPDGRLVVNGGHEDATWHGSAGTLLFDPWTESWEVAPSMQVGRYYPGTVTLADGRVLTVSGNGPDGADAPVPEVFLPEEGWTLLPDLEQTMEFYPRMHVLPGGEVVAAGQQEETWFLDVDAGEVREGPSSGRGTRYGGASVLLSDLRTVLVFGGGSMGFSSEGGHFLAFRDDADEVARNLATGREAATAGAQRLDARGQGAWRDAASMHFPRRDHQGVLLPDGTVLAVGGGAGFEPLPGWADHALRPERYEPARDAWSLMAPASRQRGYHSAAILLPDGRVLSTGGDFETGVGSVPGASRTGEIFEPPYLFRGPRPVIADAPGSVAYGAAFDVATSDAARIAEAVLVRLGSATHSLNTDQRVVPLDAEAVGEATLRARAPASGGEAPPGWYMLFLLSDEGVPSVARMVRVGA